jgi:hypothetical protein
MKMKKSILLFALIILSLSIFAQEAKKNNTKKGNLKIEFKELSDTAKIESDTEWAKSIVNQKFPLIIETWFSERPDTVGKFMVVDFWGTWCRGCVAEIPKLNKLSKQFKKDFVFIGVTDETLSVVKGMKAQAIEYYSATDTKNRMRYKLELHMYPYALIIDPKGIVRWQGTGDKVTEQLLKEIIKKYK